MGGRWAAWKDEYSRTRICTIDHKILISKARISLVPSAELSKIFLKLVEEPNGKTRLW